MLANNFPLKKYFSQVLIGLTVFVSRLGVLMANVSPLGSWGFFGNPLLYFVSIVLFDALVGGFYTGFWFTYLGFAAYPLLGLVGKKHLQQRWLLLPLASFSFFLVSNFGSWLYFYPKTWEGLLLCYTLAIPFYSRTLLGDLTFGYSFLLYEKRLAIRQRWQELRLRKHTAVS
jgi:hypothetical protein